MKKPIVNETLKAKWLVRDRGPKGIRGVMLHDTAGNGGHGDTIYISDPSDGRKAGIDFTIERDGSIWQLNHDLSGQWAQHASRATRVKFGNDVFKGSQVSRAIVGIELTHAAVPKKHLPLWPAPQVEAAAELCLYLAVTYGFDKTAVVTHAKAVTDGSRSDPRDFPFDLFWTYWNRHAGTQAPDHGMPVIHTVAPGDTLWKLAKLYKTSVESIKALNSMNTPSNVIVPGQKLLVKK